MNIEIGIVAGVLIGGLATIALVRELPIVALVGEHKEPFDKLGEGV